MSADDLSDYDVEVGEPYLHKDMNDKYVILQDETMTRHGNDWPDEQIIMYSSEILVDDNPSEAKIFQMKLKGAVRENWPF